MTAERHPAVAVRRFAPFDAAVILFLLAAGAAVIPLMASGTPATAVVYREGRIVARYPLAEEAVFRVEGATGPLTVRIHDKKIAVVSSNCPRHICQHSGAIGRPVQQIICCPNHILIEIESAGKRDVDAVAR